MTTASATAKTTISTLIHQDTEHWWKPLRQHNFSFLAIQNWIGANMIVSKRRKHSGARIPALFNSLTYPGYCQKLQWAYRILICGLSLLTLTSQRCTHEQLDAHGRISTSEWFDQGHSFCFPIFAAASTEIVQSGIRRAARFSSTNLAGEDRNSFCKQGLERQQMSSLKQPVSPTYQTKPNVKNVKEYFGTFRKLREASGSQTSSSPPAPYATKNSIQTSVMASTKKLKNFAAATTLTKTTKTLAASLNERFQDGILVPLKKNGKGGNNNNVQVKTDSRHPQQDVHTTTFLRAMKHLATVQRQLGQKANANELLKNIRKVETVYKQTPSSHRETISAILLYERDILQIHDTRENPRSGENQPKQSKHSAGGTLLRDPSAAVGLLWLRRSLEFQQQLFTMVLEIPTERSETYLDQPKDENDKMHVNNQSVGQIASSKRNKAPADATEASLLAYSRTLQNHHGWKMQKIYSLALRTTTPSRHEMLRALGGFTNSMTPHQEHLVSQDLRHLVKTWQPIVATMKQTFSDLNLEDTRRA